MRLPTPLLLAVVAAFLAAACTTAADHARPDATAGQPSDACTPVAADPGKPQLFGFGGHQRRYLLSVPTGDPGPHGFPVVVSLHGHGSSAAEHEATTSLAARGRGRGFVVVTPEGLGDPRRWNFDRRGDGPDDYAFVAALLDDVSPRACGDPRRTYVAGSSNGAAFAGFLACTEPGRVAAVAMVIATVPPSCTDRVTPSVLTIRGTADETVPYGNTTDVVAEWAAHDGCSTPAREDEPYPGVTRTTYGDCASGAQVALATVTGGLHAWPGSEGADRPGNSAAGVGFPATDEVLAFFADARQAS